MCVGFRMAWPLHLALADAKFGSSGPTDKRHSGTVHGYRIFFLDVPGHLVPTGLHKGLALFDFFQFVDAKHLQRQAFVKGLAFALTQLAQEIFLEPDFGEVDPFAR